MVSARWLLAFCVVAHTAYAASLTARVDRTGIVLGEAVTFELTAEAPGESGVPEARILDALAADFEVTDVSSSGTTEKLTLRASLYPRRSGRVRIPALRTGDARSAPIDIMVRESGAGIPRVLLRVAIEPEAPHVRAGALLYLDVYSGGNLLWSTAEVLPAAGVHLRALNGSQRSETVDGEIYTVQRYAWAATALRDGPTGIEFAALRASKFGQHLRYSVPKFVYTAQPVPAYLPVYVPVGAPELQVESLPEQLIVGRPVNWVFTIAGSGLSANGVSQLLAATLGAGRGVQLYPPVIEAVDEALARTPQQRYRVTVPVRALRHGEVELPEISIPFYDPVGGGMQAVTLHAWRRAATDPLLDSALWVLGIGVTLALLVWPARRGVAWWWRRRDHAVLLERIGHARSVAELKAALLGFSFFEDALPVGTLQQWRRQADSVADAATGLASVVARMERACYGAQAGEIEFNQLKAETQHTLRRLRRRRVARG